MGGGWGGGLDKRGKRGGGGGNSTGHEDIRSSRQCLIENRRNVHKDIWSASFIFQKSEAEMWFLFQFCFFKHGFV